MVCKTILILTASMFGARFTISFSVYIPPRANPFFFYLLDIISFFLLFSTPGSTIIIHQVQLEYYWYGIRYKRVTQYYIASLVWGKMLLSSLLLFIYLFICTFIYTLISIFLLLLFPSTLTSSPWFSLTSAPFLSLSLSLSLSRFHFSFSFSFILFPLHFLVFFLPCLSLLLHYSMVTKEFQVDSLIFNPQIKLTYLSHIIIRKEKERKGEKKISKSLRLGLHSNNPLSDCIS